MNTFLHYVARDIIAKYGTNLSHVAVVFPNKRASLFMNEELARLSDKPIWSPSYITISDLFRRHSDLQVGDPIKLICELYKVYSQIVPNAETLDKFYGWGQLMIADFDDIDKNMADADKVFANLKDIHEFDDISYLDDEQKEMIKKFFSNFSEDHNSQLKKRFLELWSHFLDIYHDFNASLRKQHLAYEGALYREVVEQQNIDFQYDTYIFVGFNMMQKVEQKLALRLKKDGKARFYWDFDKYYIQNNEAGHYINMYLPDMPNELDNTDSEIYDNLNKKKDITYISAPTENIQARYVSKWLMENERYLAGRRTAIVLADENLLQTVIHCIPKEIDKVNITLGYPLQQSPFFSLISLLIEMQTTGYKNGTDRYRLHYVNQVLHHPYTKYITSEQQTLLDVLKKHKRFYPSRDSLMLEGDEGLELLFRNCEGASQHEENINLGQWLLDILRRIGTSYQTMLKAEIETGGEDNKDEGDPLFQESLFRTYTLLNRLQSLVVNDGLEVDTLTWQRLIFQLIQTTSIPFHGEPAEGIQIMGVLETRNLDFDHLLVLSCNEGNIPKGVNDSSFIPHSIRKAYGLTTVDNKVAIYAYYFHSLIQRAGDITLTYNNATEDGHTGEMSRFMLQLMVESRHSIVRKSLRAGQKPYIAGPQQVEKNDFVKEVMDDWNKLSPTAINRYIRCPMAFYYQYVRGIKEPDEEDQDEVDNMIFGEIFHRSCQLFYLRFASPDDYVTYPGHDGQEAIQLRHGLKILPEYIEEALEHPEVIIEPLVDQAFRENLFKVSNHGYHPEYNGLQLINREVIIGYVKQLLKLDLNLAPFTILGLEHNIFGHISFDYQGGKREIKIGGIIDRLDAVNDDSGERIRVIDYKTGSAPSQKVMNLDEVFNGVNFSAKHTDYYLQTIMYAMLIKENKHVDRVSPSLLFIQHTGGKDYDPTLVIDKDKLTDIASIHDEYRAKLSDKIAEIFNPEIPFTQTEDKMRCGTCPFKPLCEI